MSTVVCNSQCEFLRDTFIMTMVAADVLYEGFPLSGQFLKSISLH